MPAAGRRTMPRPAVGVRPSTSFYAPAVLRSLRLCRGGCGGHAFAVPDVRRRVGRLDFRAPAVPRGLRLCGGGFGEQAFYIRDVRRRVGRSDFRTPAVSRGLRLCGGGLRGVRLLYSRRAPQGGPIGLSRSRRAARFAEGTTSTFATCAAGALVFHSLRQIFSRCPH